jgi:hypothetical protein
VNVKSRVCIVTSLCLNADPAPRATMVGPSRGAYTRVAQRESGQLEGDLSRRKRESRYRQKSLVSPN